MCFSCGGIWPWGHAVHLADAPTKDEYIFLDQNHAFYKDHRTPHNHHHVSPTTFSCPSTMPPYYTYDESYPSAINQDAPPSAWQWEDTRDWPKTYTYIAPNAAYQGYHPPAPVYQSSQLAMPQYYYPAAAAAAGPTTYYMNGQYYAQPTVPAPTGWPFTSPYPYNYAPIQNNPYTCFPLAQRQPTLSNCFPPLMPTAYPAAAMPYAATQPTAYATGAYGNWATLLQASTAAAAANAALSQQPSAPAYFVGATKADIAYQNQLIASRTGAEIPSQLAPYKAAAGQQFWCKETDGSWTLRTHAEVTMGEVAPGHWEKHAVSGYFFWVRH